MGEEEKTERYCSTMGVKTSISQSQLPEEYQKYELRPTKDGVSDSVYLLGNTYVLKHFDSANKQTIVNEKKLLAHLADLPVPQMLEQFQIEGKEAVLFTQAAGKSPLKPRPKQIEQIGIFLKHFHKRTQGIKNSNVRLFEKNRLKNLVEKARHPSLIDNFKTLDMELKNDGIIHGDLFMDNAKFIGDTLSGVYDFTEACEGDFMFDLAVVACSWCFNGDTPEEDKFDTLLKSYGGELDKTEFKAYIRYALLYYATTRYMGGRDYATLLKRLERLK